MGLRHGTWSRNGILRKFFQLSLIKYHHYSICLTSSLILIRLLLLAEVNCGRDCLRHGCRRKISNKSTRRGISSTAQVAAEAVALASSVT